MTSASFSLFKGETDRKPITLKLANLRRNSKLQGRFYVTEVTDKESLLVDFSVGNPQVQYSMQISQSHSVFAIPLANKASNQGYNISSSTSQKNLTSGYYFHNTSGFLTVEHVSFLNLSTNNQEIFLGDFSNQSNYVYGYFGLGNKLSITNSFIRNLYIEGSISEPIYSLNIKDMEFSLGNSSAGVYSRHKYLDFNTNDDWAFQTIGIEIFGDTYEFIQDNNVACLRVEDYFIRGPNKILEKILSRIGDNQTCYNENENYFCRCNNDYTEKYPYIHFMAEEFALFISPSSYVIFDEGLCQIMIAKSNTDEWVLGRPFFNEFFAVFNIEEQKVSLYTFVLPVAKYSIFFFIGLGSTFGLVILLYAKLKNQDDYRLISG
ncbi:hypothetical protein SteCoe_31804 [Stentor coeruleus]|uniref:Peptidase A1 domain-containing protein n=1 Tax=Stentor coeruleus TaxID=5963 RepID=A0A1R2B0I7_9CILI|nr:hypothetical protein SteCoe_31804 [Stentor coeruleus]